MAAKLAQPCERGLEPLNGADKLEEVTVAPSRLSLVGTAATASQGVVVNDELAPTPAYRPGQLASARRCASRPAQTDIACTHGGTRAGHRCHRSAVRIRASGGLGTASDQGNGNRTRGQAELLVSLRQPVRCGSCSISAGRAAASVTCRSQRLKRGSAAMWLSNARSRARQRSALSTPYVR